LCSVGHSFKVVTLEEEVSLMSSEYESSPSPSPPPPSYNMSQQQQQQQGKVSPVPVPHQQPLPTREEQLLAMIATLQQQVNTMLLHQQGSRIEVAKPQVFGEKMEEVSMFINAARLYLRMKMTDEAATTQIAWVLSYIRGPLSRRSLLKLVDSPRS